jgi:hypothetical protein
MTTALAIWQICCKGSAASQSLLPSRALPGQQQQQQQQQEVSKQSQQQQKQ